MPVRAHDGHLLYTVLYEPMIEPIGYLQFVHGMVEHIGRYDEVMAYFASKGYIVFGHDQRGHGNTATLGAGILEEEVEAEDFLKDVQTVRQHYATLPDLPYVLFGHSMGSFIVRAYIEWDPTVEHAIISSTGKQPQLALSVGKWVAKLRNKERDELLNKLSFLGFNKRVEQPVTEFDWITRDEKEVQKYILDDFSGVVPNSHFFTALFGLIERANHSYSKGLATKQLLFIAGTDDPVGNYGESVKEVAERFAKTGHDVTTFFLEGGRHEPLNEHSKEAVYAMIESWLRQFNG